MKIKLARNFISNPSLIWCGLARHNLLTWMSDETYLKVLYRLKMGKKLDLKNPKTFNEKIQWLKLYDRKPIYTTMVDKYEAKKYVADIIGEEYIIPTLGVWNSFDEIDFDSLPDQFVLKCTHDSGGLVICRDKQQLNLTDARAKIEKSMRTDYYQQGREWPYKDVKPRIIAEKYMEDSSHALKDYKFFCFGGVAKCFKIDFDRFVEHHANYYDMEKNQLNFGEATFPPVYDKEIDMSTNTDLMSRLAEKLSNEIPFLRADFYDVSGQVYFGELTFYPASGLGHFTSDDWDIKLGEWVKLPEDVGGYLVYNHDFFAILCNSIITKRKKGLTDYKFYCFDGKPKFLYVSSGLEDHETAEISFLTLDWEFAPFGRSDYRPFNKLPNKPSQFDTMLSFARKLSERHAFIRTDFYQIDEQVYFSELTFSPCSGFMPFEPEEWDKKLGEYINLDEVVRG